MQVAHQQLPINCVIISDPEGYDILKSIPEQPTPHPKIYICGDILDSTGNIGVTVKGSKVNDVILTEHTITDENRLKAKSHNLKNIYSCISNPNIQLIFGNRDLNKIKCKYLCELNNTQHNELINNYNDGQILLSYEIYERLKQILFAQHGKPWKIHRMIHWYPFWGGIKQDKKPKDWSNINLYNTGSIFLERFNEIFGADTAVGTMSAQNLLFTIPCEILGYATFMQHLQDDDYKAFIVLAIFRSMCQFNQKKIRSLSKPQINSLSVKGWLIRLYEKGKINEILESSTNIYLLSHGGLTKNIINNSDYLKQFLNSLHNLYVSDDKLFNILTNANYFYNPLTYKRINKLIDIYTKPKHGGFKTDTTVSISSDELQHTINNNTTLLNKVISSIKDMPEMNVPDHNMLFMLMITSNFDFNTFLEKIYIKSDALMISKQYNWPSAALYGPIQPGINEMRHLMFTCTNKTLYQIIGHVPVGFGATIDKFTHPTIRHTSYLITLDNSNTFTGTSINKIGTTQKDVQPHPHSESSSYIKIDNDDCFVNTLIRFNLYNHTAGTMTVERYNNDYKYTTNYETNNNNNKIFHSETLSVDNIKEIKISNKIHDPQFQKSINLTQGLYINSDVADKKYTFSVCYHGYTHINNSIYHILTHNVLTHPPSFKKNVLILNNEEFYNFCGKKIPPALLPKPNPSASHTSSQTHTNKLVRQYQQEGGYQQKYLKYKQKYLQLKVMLEQ